MRTGNMGWIVDLHDCGTSAFVLHGKVRFSHADRHLGAD